MKFPLDPSSWGNVINWGKGSQLPMEEWQEILKLAKESMGDGFYWRRGLCEAGDEIGRDHFYPFLRIADKRVDTAAWTWVESPKSAVEKMSTLVKQYG